MTRYHDYMIFGAHGVYCGLCHQAPAHCTCDVAFLQSRSVDIHRAMLEKLQEAQWRAVAAGAGALEQIAPMTERAICRCGKPVIGNEWHMCGAEVRRFGEETSPAVSLPTAPVAKEAPAEETHCVWCADPLPHTCGPHTIDGIARTVTNNEIDPVQSDDPPSGWRDRPGLL